MGFRTLAGRARSDRALVTGLAGGTVTSLAGIVAYSLVAYLTGDASSLGDALVDGAVEFGGFSPLYHVVVLVVAPFVATVAAVVAARRHGLVIRRHDVAIVGSVVAVPFATVVALYFAIAVVFGVSAVWGGADPGLADRLVGAAGLTRFALIFGVFFLLVSATAVLVGAGTGYLVGR